MRILETISIPWWNGGAQYAVSLARGLARRGHRVIVCGIEGTVPVERARGAGLRVVPGINLRRVAPSAVLSNLGRLRALLREEEVDLVNAHSAQGHLACALALRGMGRRIPLLRTKGDVRAPNPHPLAWLLYGPWTDRVIVGSEFLRRRYFQRLPCGPDKVLAIPAGIDLEEFDAPGGEGDELRGMLGIPADAVLMGMIARLSPVKGHAVFLQAAAEVARRVPRAAFLVAGEEARIRQAELRERAEALGIAERTYFTGLLPDVRSALRACDVGVVASLGSEAISRVALEFMAAARPVVGTRVGALPEAVEDGVTGRVVPPGAAGALAQALIRLCGDERERWALGQAGRKRVEERFALETMVDRTEEVYRACLGDARPGGR